MSDPRSVREVDSIGQPTKVASGHSVNVFHLAVGTLIVIIAIAGGSLTLFYKAKGTDSCQIASNSDPLSRPIVTPSSWVGAGLSM